MVEFQDFPSKILLHYRCSFHLSHVVLLSLVFENVHSFLIVSWAGFCAEFSSFCFSRGCKIVEWCCSIWVRQSFGVMFVSGASEKDPALRNDCDIGREPSVFGHRTTGCDLEWNEGTLRREALGPLIVDFPVIHRRKNESFKDDGGRSEIRGCYKVFLPYEKRLIFMLIPGSLRSGRREFLGKLKKENVNKARKQCL